MFQGSIPALVTPMREDGSVDIEAWDRLLEFHDREGTDGVVVGGTTGESPTLEQAELEALVRRAKARLGGRMPVIADSGSASTAHSIALSQAAEAAGADGLLVVTPYYNRPTQEGLYRHFLAIADAVGIPLVLYNVPGRTACDLLPATIARLSGHRRVVGVKEATGDVARAAPILRDCRPGFVLLSGDDPSAADLMRAGARGVISVTANVVPHSVHELCAAALAGRHDEADAINRRLMRLHKALFIEPNPIPVKWALVRMGLIDAGLRLPLTPLAEAYQAEMLAALLAGGVALA